MYYQVSSKNAASLTSYDYFLILRGRSFEDKTSDYWVEKYCQHMFHTSFDYVALARAMSLSVA